MGRGIIKRIIAGAILISFCGLSLAAIAPAVFGVRLDDVIRRRVAYLAADSVAVVGPLRVSVAPNIILTGARAKIIGSPEGASKSIELADAHFIIETTAVAKAATDLSTTELASVLGGATSIRIHNGSIDFQTGGVSIALLRDIDADLALKGDRVGQARGQAKYFGQVVKFDIGTASRFDNGSPKSGWPLRVLLSTPSFEATVNGVFDARDRWTFTGETEARTSDAAKLAAWLTQSWSGTETNSAFQIKGPMTWANGVIAFGKSRVLLGDQDGVGALSLSIRDRRPLIEAALAFEALDVTSLLYSQPESENEKEGPASMWRCLATHFPAARSLDADLRLSTTRLQWRGEPVGKAAFTVSARGGLVHADFAELALGSFFGSLQVAIDEREPRAPVVLRARLHAPNAALVSERIFGRAVLAGSATAKFDISGEGKTLGDVVERASGHGTIEARDGQLHLNLVAAQKLLISQSKSQTTGWDPLAGSTPYQVLAAKLQMRGGAIQLDEAVIRSAPLTAYANGRLGLSPGEVDLKLRFETSRSYGQSAFSIEHRTGLSVATTSRSSQLPGSLSIAGSWSTPILTVIPDGSVP